MRQGQRKRCGPYSAIDIAGKGRILTFVVESTGGEAQVRCLPGGKATLTEELEAAHSAL